MIKRSMIFSLLLLVMALSAVCQTAEITMIKYDEGSSLLIQIDSAGNKMFYSANCSSAALTHLPDTVKLRLIFELLKYHNDTSFSARPVRKLGALVYQVKEPKTKRYRASIDALLLINLLAFGSDIFVYSAYPVLQSLGDGHEINNPKEINKAFSVYEKWFKELSLHHFQNFSFPPLQKAGIRWLGDGVKNKIYSSPGKWLKMFDCLQYE